MYLGAELGNQDSGLQHSPRAGKPEDLWPALSLSRAPTPSSPALIRLGTKEIEKKAVLSVFWIAGDFSPQANAIYY